MIRIMSKQRYDELMEHLSGLKAARDVYVARLEKAERDNQTLRNRNLDMTEESEGLRRKLEEIRQVELVR